MRLNELRRRGKVVDWLAFLGVVSISLFLTKLANGATTYPGLHNHTAVRSKEYTSPTRLARSTSGKVPLARFVDRSPSIRPAHGNHKINHPTRVQTK